MELDREFRIEWPIRQGDILGFWNWNDRKPFEKFGVVITADCDVARARPEQELIFLRVVSQNDFIDGVWARERLEDRRRVAVGDFGKSVNRHRTAAAQEVAQIERADLERFVKKNEAAEICDELKISVLEERERLSARIVEIKRLLELCEQPFGTPCLREWSTLSKRDASALIQQANSDLARIREDIFFVGGIKDVDDPEGYYVLLDQIGSLRLDQITDSMSELRGGKRTAYRFGRLDKVFKHAMAQKFAFLFQRIGLPDEHSNRNRMLLKKIEQGGVDA